MKIAKFASIVLAVLCGVSMVSCHKIGEKDSADVVEKTVTFTVAINSGSVASNYAEVIVRHDGKDSDTWYGFLTNDLTSKEEDLINSVLSSVTKENLHLGTVQTVAVPHLDEYAVYRYIAFGVKESKELYGKPGSLTFTTNPNLDVTFGVEVSDVTTTSAKASITSTSEKYKYYGFVTEDMLSKADVLAAETLAGMVDDDNKLIANVALFQGTTFSAPIENLTPDTAYRYIVFGVFVDESGVAIYYGTPAEAAFCTQVDYDAVVFSAELQEARKSEATFEVDYNTGSEITWYAFNTEDLTTPAADLIAAVHPAAEEIKSGKEIPVTIEGLQSLTTYRFIVTGYKDGAPYGTPAVVQYETADADYDLIEFAAQLIESGQNTAKFLVTNNSGADRFQWFGFVTTDLTSEVADLLPGATSIAEADIHSGQQLEVTVEGLEPGSVYRYIVAGYREDSTGNKYVYGIPGEVTFNTTSAYTENNDWTIVYNGKKVASNTGQWRLWFHIEGTGATLGYLFLEKDVYDTYTIVDPLINDYVADVQAAIAGGDSVSSYTRGDNEGTSSWVFEPQAPGEYVALFFNVDENFAPQGQFKAVPYTVEASQATSAYNAWLGDWKAADTAGTEIWTVTADVPGETYLISGLCNMDLEVQATFNPSNNSLILFTQGLGDYHVINTSSYGELEVETYLFGQSTNGIYGGTRVIFTATMSGNEATLAPGKDSKGAEFTSTWFLLSAKDESITSLWYADSRDQVTLPQTISRPSDTGSAAYNAWLGTWSAPRNGSNDTWVITKDKVDVSYIITGIEGMPENRQFAARFDSNTGELVLNTQKDIYTYSSEGYNVSDHLYGRIDYQGTIYYVTGNYELCRGTVNGNTATLGNGVVAISAGDFDVIGMTVYAWDTDAGKALGVYLEDGEDFTRFPLTLTKTSGGSAPAKAPVLTKTSGERKAASSKTLSVQRESQTALYESEVR